MKITRRILPSLLAGSLFSLTANAAYIGNGQYTFVGYSDSFGNFLRCYKAGFTVTNFKYQFSFLPHIEMVSGKFQDKDCDHLVSEFSNPYLSQEQKPIDKFYYAGTGALGTEPPTCIEAKYLIFPPQTGPAAFRRISLLTEQSGIYEPANSCATFVPPAPTPSPTPTTSPTPTPTSTDCDVLINSQVCFDPDPVIFFDFIDNPSSTSRCLGTGVSSPFLLIEEATQKEKSTLQPYNNRINATLSGELTTTLQSAYSKTPIPLLNKNSKDTGLKPDEVSVISAEGIKIELPLDQVNWQAGTLTINNFTAPWPYTIKYKKYTISDNTNESSCSKEWGGTLSLIGNNVYQFSAKYKQSYTAVPANKINVQTIEYSNLSIEQKDAIPQCSSERCPNLVLHTYRAPDNTCYQQTLLPWGVYVTFSSTCP